MPQNRGADPRGCDEWILANWSRSLEPETMSEFAHDYTRSDSHGTNRWCSIVKPSTSATLPRPLPPISSSSSSSCSSSPSPYIPVRVPHPQPNLKRPLAMAILTPRSVQCPRPAAPTAAPSSPPSQPPCNPAQTILSVVPSVDWRLSKCIH